jgi:hypothetical protein
MEVFMYYTGIDLHKFTSFLTTVDDSGWIIKQSNIKNLPHNFIQYFSDMGSENITTVESTMTWYLPAGRQVGSMICSHLSRFP